tara:strand:+ start:3739 stop:4773 length:1035 start_codon:yes stop_codon:yes gene_type:complete
MSSPQQKDNKLTKNKVVKKKEVNKEGKKVVKKKEVKKVVKKKEDKTMSVNFSVSNLFVIMNMNYYKKFDKVLTACWRSYNLTDYKAWSEKIASEGKVNKTQSAHKQLEQIERKCGVPIMKDVYKSQASNCVASLNKSQSDIGSKVDSIKTDVKKMTTLTKANVSTEEIKKLVSEATNTRFGNFQEAGAIKTFEVQCDKKVSSGQCRLTYKIGEFNGADWILVGKIDGMTADNEVVEIKNRVKKLFKQLRDYEEPQIRTYMSLMNNAPKGFLVENLRSPSGNQINTIEVNFNDKPTYFEDNVLPAIIKFAQFFHIFFETPQMKADLMEGNEAVLYKQFQEFEPVI